MRSQRAAMPGAGGVYPGWGGWEVPGGLYRVLPSQLPGPYISHILALGPTHGQMKAFSGVLMRFLR